MKKEILEKIIKVRKNLIIDGDMSVGKTSNVMYPLVDELINKNENLVVLDSKKEYVNKYYQKLIKNNYNVVVLDLQNFNHSWGWNPLEYGYELYKNGEISQAEEYINKIARALFIDSSTCDPFWDNEAANIFVGIVFGLYEDAKEDEINLASINDVLDGFNERYAESDYTTMYFKQKNLSLFSYKTATTTIFAPKDTKGGIISVARQKLLPFVTREGLNQLLSKTTFDYKDVLNKKTAIFMIGNEDNSNINCILTMFIEFLYLYLANNSHNNYNFILDNFDILDNFMALKEKMSSGIAKNMKFIIVTRDLENLLAKYSNYILKLASQIEVNDTKIKYIVNGEEKEEPNDITQTQEKFEEVNYKGNIVDKVHIFDLKSFVNSKVTPESKINEEEIEIDELVKIIDKKLKALDEVEKNEKYNKLAEKYLNRIEEEK